MRGCTKVSAGCKHCYAETFAERWRGIPGHAFEFGFDLRLVPEKLGQPFQWGSSKRIFVNSMSDLFHEEVPDDYIETVAAVMLAADWHTYQVLTKRPERLKSLLKGKLVKAAKAPHIWWGVSVENREHGLPRIPLLQESGATMKFLSIEPLIGPLGKFGLKGIDWAIVGGESGPGARPMEQSWVDSIHRQCQRSDVPFFFKQWGGVQKSKTGRILHGRTYDEFPPPNKMPIPPNLAERRRLLDEVQFEYA